jgi:hypothetical protein
LVASAKIKPAANQVRLSGPHLRRARTRCWCFKKWQGSPAAFADPPTPVRIDASSTTFGISRHARHRFRGVLCLDVGLFPTQPPSLFFCRIFFFSLMRTNPTARSRASQAVPWISQSTISLVDSTPQQTKSCSLGLRPKVPLQSRMEPHFDPRRRRPQLMAHDFHPFRTSSKRSRLEGYLAAADLGRYIGSSVDSSLTSDLPRAYPRGHHCDRLGRSPGRTARDFRQNSACHGGADAPRRVVISSLRICGGLDTVLPNIRVNGGDCRLLACVRLCHERYISVFVERCMDYAMPCIC